MNKLVQEARALCEGATAGPWVLTKDGRYEDHDECRIELPDDDIELCRYENGELCARSRTLIPEMAEEIEQLEQERDRFKARAEAAEKDITALARRAIDGFQDSKFITPCRWCAEREQCDLLTNGMNTCFKWRGPQEGAADVECSAKPEASKENTHDFYGIIMDNVVDHIQQCYTKETVTLSDGTRAVIRRWKPFPDMTKEGENG